MSTQNEKKSYKTTLNLPTTSFSIRSGMREKEPAFREHWEQAGVRQEFFTIDPRRETFLFHDGPPYANGNLHMGHALNKIMKDMALRIHRMNGKNVSFIPGWDCHGLPIELKVQQEQAGRQSVSKAACRAYAQKWIEIQEEQFKTFGVWAEWEDKYLTMNPGYEAEIIRAFGQFVDQGFIERKGKTIPWCFSCETTLATAEIEHKERKDPSCYIQFPATDESKKTLSDLLGKNLEGDVGPVIWTTTPWTIPLNRAVVLHPDAQYVFVKLSDAQEERVMFLAEALLPKFQEIYQGELEKIGSVHSSELAGLQVHNPLVPETIVPVLTDNSVLLSDGTACMHSAPGCGPEDYILGVKNKLEIYSPLSGDGRYTDEILPQELAGEKITDGQWWVLKQLKLNGYLIHKGSLKHAYPHCWRCHNGLMFRATDQWFCNLENNNLMEQAGVAVAQMNFIPEWGRRRLDAFVSNRTEWCISRQRSWGTPIPAVLNKETGRAFTSKALIDWVADRVETEGIEFWDRVTIAELCASGTISHEYLSENREEVLVKERDILDVWFDSGVSHTAVMKRRLGVEMPVDLYLEGSDQHRGWFQSALLTSVVMHQKPQAKTILTHGFVVDKNGHKMSKSVGNVVDPHDIISQYGVDVLRLWVASSDYESDIAISDDVMKQTSEQYRKIRNTARFLLANIFDLTQSDCLERDNLLPLDLYALQEAERISGEVQKLYREYKLAQAMQIITKYCTVDLSAFYLDICKDRLYVSRPDSTERRSAQTALAGILEILTKLIAPVLVYTAEEINQANTLSTVQSIHLSRFSQNNPSETGGDPDPDTERVISSCTWCAPSGADLWAQMRSLRKEVLKAIEVQRASGAIKHSLESSVTLCFDNDSLFLTDYRAFCDRLEQSGVTEELFFKEWYIVSQYNRAEAADFSQETIYKTDLPGVSVLVTRARGEKCPRCWHYSENNHPDSLCERCVSIVE